LSGIEHENTADIVPGAANDQAFQQPIDGNDKGKNKNRGRLK